MTWEEDIAAAKTARKAWAIRRFQEAERTMSDAWKIWENASAEEESSAAQAWENAVAVRAVAREELERRLKECWPTGCEKS